MGNKILSFSKGFLLLILIWASFSNTYSQKKLQNDAKELTFEKGMAGDMADIKTGEGISFMKFLCSDGKIVRVYHFNVGESYKVESARFKAKLRKATKLIEITSILSIEGKGVGKRAVFQQGKDFKILKLFRVDRRVYYSDFEFYEIVAPTLRHLIAFENRKR